MISKRNHFLMRELRLLFDLWIGFDLRRAEEQSFFDLSTTSRRFLDEKLLSRKGSCRFER